MRHVIAVLGLFALAACGSDYGTDASATYPAAAGTYALSGAFDNSGVQPFTGTVTLVQPSRAPGTLTATCDVTVILGAGPVRFTVISGAAISETGLVTFLIPSNWQFTGMLKDGTITGTHTHSIPGSTGTFTMVKQ